MTALVALLVFGPYLRDLGLFGSRDIFMAAVLGMVLLIRAPAEYADRRAAVRLRDADHAGGTAVTRGFQRYTFGLDELASGFNLIVVIVGIFALSQALFLMIGKDDDAKEVSFKGGLFRGLSELRKYPLITTLSGMYGTIMGIIPGVGEFVAQFFSYATARSLSKEPQRFGHGSPEGLIASETANNAVPAAAMIPLGAGSAGSADSDDDGGLLRRRDQTGAGYLREEPGFSVQPVHLAADRQRAGGYHAAVLDPVHRAHDLHPEPVPRRVHHDLRLCRGVRHPQQLLRLRRGSRVQPSATSCALNWPLVPVVLGMVLGAIMIERLTAGSSRVKPGSIWSIGPFPEHWLWSSWA